MLIFSTKNGDSQKSSSYSSGISTWNMWSVSQLVRIDLVSHHASHRKLETVVLTSFASFRSTSSSDKGIVSTTTSKKDIFEILTQGWQSIRAEQIPGTSKPPPTSTLGSGGRIWKGFPFKQNLVSKSLPSFWLTRFLFCFPSLHFVQMVHSRSECPAYMILFIFLSGNGISDTVKKTQHQFLPGFTPGFWLGFTSP